MREGIDSISLNFDTFAKGRINTWRTEIIEEKLETDNKTKAYEFLNECDLLISKIRIPRGKLRNMVRKQRKNVDPKLQESTNRFNEIFEAIQEISVNFVQEINKEAPRDFNDTFKDFDNKIMKFSEEIPVIQKKVRDFGIY